MRRRGTVAKEAPSRAHELRLSVRRRRGSELERGGIKVSMWRNEWCQHTLPTRLHRCVGSAMQGPRHRAFGHVSSASGVGGARLRHRAPGAGIPTGAATGGSRAAGSVDAMLHDMRRRCNGSRLQVDRWAMRWCEDSTCGWLDNGNSAGDDTRARCRGNWGKTTPTGGPHLSTTTAW
jgi:hypothetical protein